VENLAISNNCVTLMNCRICVMLPNHCLNYEMLLFVIAGYCIGFVSQGIAVWNHR